MAKCGFKTAKVDNPVWCINRSDITGNFEKNENQILFRFHIQVHCTRAITGRAKICTMLLYIVYVNNLKFMGTTNSALLQRVLSNGSIVT